MWHNRYVLKILQKQNFFYSLRVFTDTSLFVRVNFLDLYWVLKSKFASSKPLVSNCKWYHFLPESMDYSIFQNSSRKSLVNRF